MTLRILYFIIGVFVGAFLVESRIDMDQIRFEVATELIKSRCEAQLAPLNDCEPFE